MHFKAIIYTVYIKLCKLGRLARTLFAAGGGKYMRL